MLQSVALADGREFTCLVDRPPSPARGAVLFLSGLGEDRSGHNYLFSELSRTVVEAGYEALRFDFGGQGDSLLPLDLDIWREQFDRVLALVTNPYGPVHVVLRGAARAAVADRYDRGYVVALRPAEPGDFGASSQRVRSRSLCGLLKLRPDDVDREEAEFWTALGVEVRAIGGLFVADEFLAQLLASIRPVPSSWVVPRPSGDPLFLLESSRKALAEKLSKLLAAPAASTVGAGLLVAVEGIDGSGKSTLVEAIARELSAAGVRVRVERPLTPDREFVDRVRALHARAGADRVKQAFLAAYFSYRLATVANAVIEPLVAAGEIIVADRYLDSHRVNQSVFGVDLDDFEPLFAAMPRPDVTLYLDVPLDVALARLSRRAHHGVGDDVRFLEQARARFETLAEQNEWVRLDGANPLEDVVSDGLAAITGKLGRRELAVAR
ncbi:MAG: dTMP kinase [Acidimicrobiia bacterium]